MFRLAKQHLVEGLRSTPDLNQLKEQLGAIPAWLVGAAAGDMEKLTWLNALLAEVRGRRGLGESGLGEGGGGFGGGGGGRGGRGSTLNGRDLETGWGSSSRS